ncbi:hypothetical protein O181_008011 [Austropuccinia psidii MF-1]|uniref:Tf2-1-like SH3-like domain-containing protein n=1 Tax=Austropuccinia psidii MF-1 TaxID=1389203 RepID=A0A9Q3GI50_9BASI|nr:hypothetical protein [Austropuccinia psidii MF-1]
MAFLQEHEIKQTTKKLPERLLGLFPIFDKLSTYTYHLKLPSQCQSINPVFHISLLEPFNTSVIPNRHKEPTPLILMEEEGELEVYQKPYSNLKRR